MRMVLALGMLLVRSPETVWIGLFCLAGMSALSAFFQPASGASLPNLVAPGDLAAANTLTSASWGTMLAVGAALGGLVAGTLGREAAFVIDAVSFLVSALLVVRIRADFSQRLAPGQVAARSGHSIREGFGYARSDSRVLALLASKGGFGLGVGVVALLPIFATDVFRAGDEGIGLLFAARGVGALLGPFLAIRYVRDDESRLLIALAASIGIYGLCYLALSAAPNLAVAAAIGVVAHLGGGAQWVLSSYGLQRILPDFVRGRILALDLGLVSLTIVSGSARWPPAAWPTWDTRGRSWPVWPGWRSSTPWGSLSSPARCGQRRLPQCEAIAIELHDSRNSAVIMISGMMVQSTSMASTRTRPGAPSGLL